MFSRPLNSTNYQSQTQRVTPCPEKKIIDRNEANQKISQLIRMIRNLPQDPSLFQRKKDLLNQHSQLQKLLANPSTRIGEVQTQKIHYKINLMNQQLLGGMDEQRQNSNQEKAQSSENQTQNANNISENQKSTLLSWSLEQLFINSLIELVQIKNPQLKQVQDPSSLPKKVFINEKETEDELNFCQLVKLIEEAVKASNKTSGLDVIFLIGKTGAGKSTLVHYLNGVPIQDVAPKSSSSGTAHKPILKLEYELDGFRVSDQKISVTKVVNVLNTPKFDIVDSAGLSDTNGLIYDLANTIGLEKAFHNANSVRMLIVIQQCSIWNDTRGKALIGLINELVGYVKKIEMKDFIPTVSIAISHPVHSLADTTNQLQSIYDAEKQQPTIADPQERQRVLTFLDSMIGCSKLQDNQSKIHQKQKQKEQEQDLLLVKIRQIDEIIENSNISQLQAQVKQNVAAIQYQEKKLKALEKEKDQQKRKKKQDSIKEELNELKQKHKIAFQALSQEQSKLSETLNSKKNLQEEWKGHLEEKVKLQKQFDEAVANAKSTKILFNSFTTFFVDKLISSKEAEKATKIIQQSPRITNPSEIFQISIKNELQTKTEGMIMLVKMGIYETLKKKNFQKVEKDFEKICFLKNFIPTKKILKHSEDCLKAIIQKFEEQCNEFRSTLDFQMSQDGTLSEQAISDLEDKLSIMQSVDSFVRKLAGYNLEDNTFEGLSIYLINKISQTCFQINQSLQRLNYSSISLKVKKVEKLFVRFGKKYPDIAGSFEELAHSFRLFCMEQIIISVTNIQTGEYEQLITQLNFLRDSSELAQEYFNLDLEQKYHVIVEKCKQSLSYRVQIGFQKLTQSLSLESLPLIKAEITQINKLKENQDFLDHITKAFVSQLHERACCFIERICNQFVDTINGLINESKFNQIKDKIFILRDLRTVDSTVIQKTADKYSGLVSKLKNDISGKSIQNINEILKKIKHEQLTEDDIELVRETIEKISKLEFLKDFIGQNEIIGIKENALKTLSRHANSVKDSIQKIFKSQLDTCDENQYFNSSNKIFFEEDTANISRILSERRPKQPKYFIKLNQSLQFVRQLGSIHQDVLAIATQAQSKVDQLMKAQLQQFKRLRQQQRIKEGFNLHELQLEFWLVKLVAMEAIDSHTSKQVQTTITSIVNEVKTYFSDCLQKISTEELDMDSQIKKYIKAFQKLNSSLSQLPRQINYKYLEKRYIKIQDLKCSLRSKLQQKFDALFENIDKLTKEESLKQCSSKIEILKKYTSSAEINTILENKPKQKYEAYVSTYSTKIDNIPEQINKIFTQKKYEQLKQLYQQYKQIGNLKNCKKIESRIRDSLNQTFKEIQELINEKIQNFNDSEMKNLNSKIKQFRKFQTLNQIINDKTMNELFENIEQLIKAYEISKRSFIVEKITKKNMQNIKTEMQKVNRIYQYFLPIIRKDNPLFNKDELQQKLNTTIEQMMVPKFEKPINFKAFQNNLKQLKIYDQQYSNQSQLATDYAKQLKNALITKCKQFQSNISGLDLDALDDKMEQFKVFKSEFEEYLSNLPEFNELLKKFQSTENIINGAVKIMMSDNKYDPAYLNRLKNKNPENYQKIIKDLQGEYQKQLMKLKQSIDNRKYEAYAKDLKEFLKFQPLSGHDHIFLNHPKPLQAKAAQKQLIAKQTSNINHSIFNLFSQKPQQGKAHDKTEIESVRQFMSIMKNIDFNQKEDADLLTDIKQTHAKIGEYFTQAIPRKTDQSQIDEMTKRADLLKKNSQMITLLKEYILDSSIVSKRNILYDQSDFCVPIRNIENATQTSQSINQYLKKIPKEIEEHWSKNELKDIQIKLNKVKVSCRSQKKMSEEYESLVQKTSGLIKTLGSQIEEQLKSNDFNDFTVKLSKIQKAQKQFSAIKDFENKNRKSQYDRIMELIEQKIEKNIMIKARSKILEKQTKPIVDYLAQLKQWVDKIPILEEKVHRHILIILSQVNRLKLTGDFVTDLEEKSDDKSNPLLSTYLAEILVKYQKELAIQKIFPKMAMSIQKAIEFFESSSPSHNKKQLKKAYDIYFKEYQQLQTKYICKSSTERIQNNLIEIKKKVKQTVGKTNNLKIDRQNIAKLVAQLFIYISIIRSADKYYQARQNKDKKFADSLLFQPHPIQVLSILKFFGCDIASSFFASTPFFAQTPEINNQFMEIKTGEGKSIILGLASLIYGLLGHHVSTVCYSSYLSKRDYDSFADIFTDFGVDQQIQYGTLSDIFNNIINKNQVLRNSVGDLFMDTKTAIQDKQPAKKSESKKILILDEVDTFFGKEFYGNTYNPCKIIQEQNILAIIRLIWSNRMENSQKIFSLIKQSTHYEKLKTKYPDVVDQFLVQFRVMVDHVKDFDSKEYVVKNNKIGYKQLDGVSYDIVDGYRTMFLYMCEREKGLISESSEKSIMGINISCGKYSYAEMIGNFDKIFGVTGTLDCFTDFQRRILKKYNINETCKAPSVYGTSNRRIQPILIENCQSNHFQVIAKTIEKHISVKIPCLVFFENQAEIEKFTSSSYAEYFKDNLFVVTQKNDPENRDFLIRKATMNGRLTLFTPSFGRGTDFIVCDPIVKDRGVAVIQTFVSQQLSEQQQIMGRTARQGQKGTYQLILNYEKLQNVYNITMEEIQKVRQTPSLSIQKLLDQKRKQILKITNEKREALIEFVKNIHVTSLDKRMQILLKSANRNDDWFFIKPNGSSLVRIAILIDSTGSMGKVIDAVKGKVMDMIEKLNTAFPKKFQIQIMFYYGYNAYEKQSNSNSWGQKNKIHASDWTSNIKLLNKFLKDSGPSGGSNHEGIQIALHHLIKENQFNGVNKAILIGDAGLDKLLDSQLSYAVHPDDAYRYSPQEVKQPLTLKFSNLVEQLQKLKIHVDTYAIGNNQKINETCELIAMRTMASVTNFNPEKDDLAAKIEVVITEQILMKK